MKFQHHQPIQDKIIEAIRGNQEFLLLTHLSPDGDSLGSQVALRRVLARLGKRCCVLCPGQAPPEYDFLIAGEEMRPSLPPAHTWDVVFVLDIPCASRLPEALSGEIPAHKELINIDHHAGNDIRGSLNWVDPRASSVGEMLFQLFHGAGYEITSDVATALYTAILTDTGSFRFPNTTPESLGAAAQLIRCGADAAYVADQVYASHSLRKHRLLGEALSTLQTCCSGRVAYMWVTAEMRAKAGAPLSETDGFVNFPREVKGVEVAVLFKQEDDGRSVKISLRSRGNLVEVARVAEQFQGGGHPAAAGCTVRGSMESVQERVLQAVREELARVDALAAGSASPQTSLGG